MTFRVKGSWGQDSSNGGANCAQVDTSTIELIDVSAEPLASPVAVEHITIPVTGNWQIDLFGRTSQGDPAGDFPTGAQFPNGIRVRTTSNCVINSAPGSGVVLIPEPNNAMGNPTSGFYSGGQNIDSEDGTTHMRRYQDKYCATPASGDEDQCEHMGSIYINTSFTNTPRSSPAYKFRCLNGECTVGLGKPQ